jgi:hypothetical protein
MKRRATPTCASSAENSIAAQKKLALAETERRIRALLESGRIPPAPIPRELIYTHTISGARAGVVLVNAELYSEPAYRWLSALDAINARQLVAWNFRDIQVYLEGAWIRIEASWPREWWEYYSLLQNWLSGKLVVGVGEYGDYVTLTFADDWPHLLIGGTTGSGKTTLLRAIGTQLLYYGIQVVLLDGKGVGLLPLANGNAVVGPVAYSVEDAVLALSWLVGVMEERYREIAGGRPRIHIPHIFVLWDEFPEHTQDKRVVRLLSRLASRGREANIHLVLATQHPSLKMFGDESIRRQFPMRIALKVVDQYASDVIIGGPEPRANLLTGSGDAYLIADQVTRFQALYISEEEIRQVLADRMIGPILKEWPLTAGEDDDDPAVEIAAAIATAVRGRGRPYLNGMVAGGADKLRRLLATGKRIVDELEKLGITLSDRETNSPDVTD